LREEARRIIEEAIETDRVEDELYGQARGDELPAELCDPGTRKARIRELLEQARAEVEKAEQDRAKRLAEQAEKVARTGRGKPGGKVQPRPSYNDRRLLARKYNITDPDSRVVRHRGMLLQGYNVHTVIGDGQIILSAAVTDSAVDQGQLAPAIQTARENLAKAGIDEPLGEVLADTGYWSGQQISKLQAQKIKLLVPPLIRSGSKKRQRSTALAMQAKLADPKVKDRYKRRQQIAEPVFAQIKHNRGITRLFRRGRQAVQAEIGLIATTHNLLKLYHAASGPQAA
jgi:hypothetical protein